MRKLTLLLVGGLLILAACIPSTPGPLSIPQTGGTGTPAASGTTTVVGGPGSGTVTIVQPGADQTGTAGPGQSAGTWTPVPGTSGQQTTPPAGQNLTGTPSSGQATGSPATGTTTPRSGQETGIPLTDPQPTDQVPQRTTTVQPGTAQPTGVSGSGGSVVTTGTPATNGTPGTETSVDYTYSNFLDDLRGQSGLTVEERGQVQEPFFNVAGRMVRINNADVTVFEFPDAASHQTALGTITANGGIIGAITPYWNARPNFFSKGSLIVLYLGSDQATLDLLRQTFGDPLTYTNMVGGLSPDTAFRIQSRLSDRFGVGLDQIRILDVSAQNWPDACLGLGGAAESCAKVVTPGYSLTVEVGGTRYNLRTNQTATLLRYQQQ